MLYKPRTECSWMRIPRNKIPMYFYSACGVENRRSNVPVQVGIIILIVSCRDRRARVLYVHGKARISAALPFPFRPQTILCEATWSSACSMQAL